VAAFPATTVPATFRHQIHHHLLLYASINMDGSPPVPFLPPTTGTCTVIHGKY
jgi:hypothetical protein